MIATTSCFPLPVFPSFKMLVSWYFVCHLEFGHILLPPPTVIFVSVLQQGEEKGTEVTYSTLATLH